MQIYLACSSWKTSITDASLANYSTRHAAAIAKSLQSCPTLCGPIDAAHQAPPSLGFPRQQHWGGLPFPSPTIPDIVVHKCYLTYLSLFPLYFSSSSSNCLVQKPLCRKYMLLNILVIKFFLEHIGKQLFFFFNCTSASRLANNCYFYDTECIHCL